ncbi:hypothetical protein JOD57_000177 [Geodermatophilus bullaregiensis]|nr:hypothetical protein [Geodermatophilus bullaregiensis]
MHASAQQGLQVADEGRLVGDPDVYSDEVLAITARQAEVPGGPHHRDDQRHERGGQGGRAVAPAAERAQRQGGDVVGDLVLVELGGAQSDDRQDAEEAGTPAGADAAAAQRGGDGEDADVHAEVGHDQVTAAVAREGDAERQDADGGEVGGGECEG